MKVLSVKMYNYSYLCNGFMIEKKQTVSTALPSSRCTSREAQSGSGTAPAAWSVPNSESRTSSVKFTPRAVKRSVKAAVN